MITPNDLIRGAGTYAGLCPEERIILMGGLSCKDGYETTLDAIEGWLCDGLGRAPGRNRQEAYRRTLRERGFLKTQRGHVPKGRRDGGQIMWEYTFYMEPLSIENRDDLPAKKHHAGGVGAEAEDGADGKPETAGHTTPLQPGPGGRGVVGSDETAGPTTPPLPGLGRPGHGEPGPGRDHLYKEEKTKGLEELKTSSSLSSETEETRTVKSEEEDPSIEDEHPNRAAMLLVRLYDRHHVAEARRPNGSRRSTLIDLAADRLAAGWSPEQLLRSLDETLAGVDSVFAVMRHRLCDLPVDPPNAPAPRSQSHRCDKGVAHEVYPADKCPICTEEARDAKVPSVDAAEDDARPQASSAPTKLSGIEAARAVAAQAGSGRKVELSRWAGRTETARVDA